MHPLPIHADTTLGLVSLSSPSQTTATQHPYLWMPIDQSCENVSLYLRVSATCYETTTNNNDINVNSTTSKNKNKKKKQQKKDKNNKTERIVCVLRFVKLEYH